MIMRMRGRERGRGSRMDHGAPPPLVVSGGNEVIKRTSLLVFISPRPEGMNDGVTSRASQLQAIKEKHSGTLIEPITNICLTIQLNIVIVGRAPWSVRQAGSRARDTRAAFMNSRVTQTLEPVVYDEYKCITSGSMSCETV